MKQLCAKTQMDTTLCACDPCEVRTIEPEAPAFAVVRMSDVPHRKTEWIIRDLLPASDVVVLVGEEGIGKGLWWIEQVREVTRRGMPVVMIVAEDDPYRALRPRMEAAGVNLDLVHLIVEDMETLTGHPYLPTHIEQVTEVLAETEARVLILDPWISVVPGKISLKDPQQARAALDPLTMLARRTGVCIIPVAHTNRSDGSTRDRVGLTSVLRQVCRVMILAIEEPDDETELLVGIDKANITGRGAASRWVKQGHGDAWFVRLAEADTGLSIRDWDAQFRAMDDGRTTDKWADVLAVASASGGMVTRQDVTRIYGGEEHIKAVDKALARWVGMGRIIRADRGIYEVPTAENPPSTPLAPIGIAGSSGSEGPPTSPTPHKTNGGTGGAAGGLAQDEADILTALEAALDQVEPS